VDLSTAQLIAGALLAVVVSRGSVGLPGQVTFIATNLPVAQAMGLPLSPLGLMLAVDTIPDALATLATSPATSPPPAWWHGSRATTPRQRPICCRAFQRRRIRRRWMAIRDPRRLQTRTACPAARRRMFTHPKRGPGASSGRRPCQVYVLGYSPTDHHHYRRRRAVARRMMLLHVFEPGMPSHE
jgi:hypothetical protein